jgi:ATP-binding cassette subfamily F protein 3
LDEPTNHLDISSKNILQKALVDFKGSLVLVSHDVDFLMPIVDKVVEIRKKSFKIFLGGIDDYLYKRQQIIETEKSSAIKSQTVSDSISRKEQKRIEAEQRQKKYLATKDVIKKIGALEEKIDKLEKKQKELEKNLAEEKFYSDPLLLKEMTANYNRIKFELENTVEEWHKQSEQLAKIESQFT